MKIGLSRFHSPKIASYENIIEKCADSEMHFLLDFSYNECQRFNDFRKKLKRNILNSQWRQPKLWQL